jgi:hypothetical protein
MIGNTMVPMMARVAAVEPEIAPRKAAITIAPAASPPLICPNHDCMKSRTYSMPPLRRRRFPARMKKGQASSGKELMLLKANPAIPEGGIPITVRPIIREPIAKAIANGMPLTSRTNEIATVKITKMFILIPFFQSYASLTKPQRLLISSCLMQPLAAWGNQ